jgi:rhodanese-related sulfurtransferase
MAIIDVREKDEFTQEFIPGSIHLPMSQLDLLAPGILQHVKDDKILIMCKSGNRARLTLEHFKKKNWLYDHNFEVYEGGITAWKAAGHAVQSKGESKESISIMRQVQITAGSIVALGIAGSFTLNPNFIYVSLFVGLGLVLSGVSGTCMLGNFLSKMPWNR